MKLIGKSKFSLIFRENAAVPIKLFREIEIILKRFKKYCFLYAFRVLITKESPDEKVILRDIHRTFPAHEFFKEAGGVGQESLYRISKVFNLSHSIT